MFCCSLAASWDTELTLYHLSVKVQCTKLRATIPFYPVISGPEFRYRLPADVLGKMCGLSKAGKECKQHILHGKNKNKGQWENGKKKVSSLNFRWTFTADAHTKWLFFPSPILLTKSSAAGSSASTHKCPVLVLWSPINSIGIGYLCGLLCPENIYTQKGS